MIGFNVFDWRRFPVFVNVPGAMLYGFVSFLLMLLVITVVGDSVFGLLVAVIWELYKGHK